jgi:hypothetical protein
MRRTNRKETKPVQLRKQREVIRDVDAKRGAMRHVVDAR